MAADGVRQTIRHALARSVQHRSSAGSLEAGGTRIARTGVARTASGSRARRRSRSLRQASSVVSVIARSYASSASLARPASASRCARVAHAGWNRDTASSRIASSASIPRHRALDPSDGGCMRDTRAERRRDRDERCVKGAQGAPVGHAADRACAMHGLDRCLELKPAHSPACAGVAEESFAPRDELSVPE